jgi:dipeptidyl aminopeptidase/acylaminoacyl peptidase
MTPDDLWRLVRVGPPVPAADGSFHVVGVKSADLEKDELRERLWRVRPGSPPEPLTAADVSSGSPAISPDGRTVAFVRKVGERPQIWLLPLGGGEARALTDLPLGAGDPRWLPDGRRIVCVAHLHREALTVDGTRRFREEHAKRPVRPQVTDDVVYRFWDRWLTDGSVPHLFVVDAAAGDARDLTPDSARWFDLMEEDGQYDLSPDGSEIAFAADISEPPHSRMRWAIFTVPVGGGAVRCITPDHPADALRPRYSPDGSFIAYGQKMEWDDYADRVRLARFDRGSGEHAVLTEGWDRSPTEWEFADARTLLALAEDRAHVALYRVPVDRESSAPEVIVRGGSMSGLRLAAGHAWVAHDTVRRPPEAARVPVAGGALERLTRFNDGLLEELCMGELDERVIRGAGGDEVHVAVLYPPGHERAGRRRWPLVHCIHGGPYGMSGDHWHWRWNAQVFAAPGYVVAMVNFHGSSSFGTAFAKSILGDWGGKAAQDILLATDALAQEPTIDVTRTAITGGSFGGYMTAWLTTQTDRFRCAIAHAAVCDLTALYAGDVTQGLDRDLGGRAWTADGLARLSRFDPTRHAAGFQTPTLVVHGANDYRVPATQALELYGLLRAKGVEARLVHYPDENHWILKPRNSLHWYGEFLGWLARHLA